VANYENPHRPDTSATTSNSPEDGSRQSLGAGTDVGLVAAAPTRKEVQANPIDEAIFPEVIRTPRTINVGPRPELLETRNTIDQFQQEIRNLQKAHERLVAEARGKGLAIPKPTPCPDCRGGVRYSYRYRLVPNAYGSYSLEPVFGLHVCDSCKGTAVAEK